MTCTERNISLPCLCLVIDNVETDTDSLTKVVSLAIDGGVNMVQLRAKELPLNQFKEMAILLRDIVDGRAMLMINSRADVAASCGADGVQFSEKSKDVSILRKVNKKLLIGSSVHSVNSAALAEKNGADFLIVGTVFESTSHPGLRSQGIELLTNVRDVVEIPFLGIGGINATNAHQVLECGASGVALISAIADNPDPKTAAQEIYEAIWRKWVRPN